MRRYTRPLAELWPLWQARARAGIHPFEFTLPHDVERVLTSLGSYDRDAWAAAFSTVAAPYQASAEDAERAGDAVAARENYLRAYGYYRLARYPTTNSDAKLAAYRNSQDMLLRGSRYFTIPIERVEIPFRGRAGEGDRIIAYLRTPRRNGQMPLLIASGGIDTFKEDILRDHVLDLGIAILAIDIPGVGDAPLPGSQDAERMFDAVFDWVGGRPQFDAERAGYWGASTGGYWAVKVAHTHRDHLACVVSHGGCAHYAFDADWIEAAQWGEYPFELAETLAYAFGHNTFEEWVDYAPQLSLRRQGILDQPCAEMLLVNGLHDSVFPIRDCYLLLEHGTPKSARFFDASHMGYTAETETTILDWIAERLKHRAAHFRPLTHHASGRKTIMADPKSIARKSFQVMESGDQELAQQIIAPDFINAEADDDPEDVERQQHGPAGFLATGQWLRDAFSNLRFELQETLAEGNTVIAVATMTGQHTGVFNGIEPTRRPINHKQVHIFTITEGMITHHRAVRDDLGLLLSLGWRPGSHA